MNAIAIDQLSREEKLALMEELWKSLSAPPEKFQSPDWHQKVLEERLARIERGEEQFFSLDEAKKRLGLI